MSRLLPVSGILAATMGAAWLIPAVAEWTDQGAFERQRYAVVSVGPILIISGLIAIWCGFRTLNVRVIPASVRAVLASNGLFLTFCALEFSDGLIRQGGRVFYWTSVLFLPALLLFYGQVLGQRWAWWVTRVAAALVVLGLVAFIVLIPFADLRADGVSVPWWGRLYMVGVTLVFASISAYAFRLLGGVEARTFYGLALARRGCTLSSAK